MSLVTTEDRGAVRHVVLNRPEKRNAMSQALLVELREALSEAAGESCTASYCAARAACSPRAWT